MGWTVRRNDFPKVLRQLRQEPEDAIDQCATEMMDALRPILWFRTGVLKSSVKEQAPGFRRATVWVGENTGKAFYAAYQEFGTVNQAARPVVGPTAMAFEPRYTQLMTQAIRRACRV